MQEIRFFKYTDHKFFNFNYIPSAPDLILLELLLHDQPIKNIDDLNFHNNRYNHLILSTYNTLENISLDYNHAEILQAYSKMKGQL